MKVLLVNTSPHEKGCTYTALCEIEKIFVEENIETEIVQIGKEMKHPCIACGVCRKAGKCVFDDDPVNECIEKLTEADGFVIGSPVYFAGETAQAKMFMDRMFFMKNGAFAYKPAAAIASARRGGLETTVDSMNKYFSISQMPIVSSTYWNSVHGNTPEEVLEDKEGMQVMRNIGRNMA